MSPACHSIKLQPKDQNAIKKKVDYEDAARRSRAKASSRAKNNRTHNTFSDLSGTQTRFYSQNQDMAEMLFQGGGTASSNKQEITFDGNR